VAANNMIISGHYALAANNVAANDQISCSACIYYRERERERERFFIPVLHDFLLVF
jgi:hypothetical protein